jgi:predicted acyltransferase (DUF342 family)
MKEEGAMPSRLLVAMMAVTQLSLGMLWPQWAGAQPSTTGSIAVGGSAHVKGPVTVQGTLSVDGSVYAEGPITAAWFSSPGRGYPPPPARGLLKVFHGPLTVHGTMVVHGDLHVDGPLTVTGPLEAGGGIDAGGPMVERQAR